MGEDVELGSFAMVRLHATLALETVAKELLQQGRVVVIKALRKKPQKARQNSNLSIVPRPSCRYRADEARHRV